MVSIDAEEAGGAFEYKFVIPDAMTGSLKRWEAGCNRRYVAGKGEENDAVVRAFLASPAGAPFELVGSGLTEVPGGSDTHFHAHLRRR